jgi:hypothetical protein
MKDNEIISLKKLILKIEKNIADKLKMNLELENLNLELKNQISELKKLIPIPVPEPEGPNIEILENEISNLKFEIVQVNLELQSCQKLIITLKDSIRDMGGKDISFMDSFEEVCIYVSMYIYIYMYLYIEFICILIYVSFIDSFEESYTLVFIFIYMHNYT